MPLIVGAIVFVAAGRIDLPMVWGVLVILTLLCIAVAVFADRGMMRERQAPGPGNRDRFTRPLSVVLLVAHWVLAGLDVGRFHWSQIPVPLEIIGLVGYALSLTIVFWAMRSNPYYSSVVRVQTERGHSTVSSGPYRYVRHPGYAASLAGMFFGGLALGSWWAMIPLSVVMIAFIRRTILEDRLLQRKLPGYAEYARQVGYRLIVGVF